MVIAGGRGVVGRHLIAHGQSLGWDVVVLTRRALESSGQTKFVEWQPADAARGEMEAVGVLVSALEGADLAVNLAGEPLMNGRLSAPHRQRVVQTRVDCVDAFGHALAATERCPSVWLQASAVGYYGDRGDELITEESERGDGILSDVCKAWEEAAEARAEALSGTRLCIMRIGVVMAPDADAWKRMSLPIKLGVGGPLGSGEQWYAWISAKDLARAFFFAAENSSCSGPLNVTAPQPIRQRELAGVTAAKLGRPTLIPTPAFALRLALGKHVANEMVLASCRAEPRALTQLGFQFEMGSFESALPWLLG